MLNPKSLDLSSLPWLPLDTRSSFPRQPCIYFAINSQSEIQYIGRTANARQRWTHHHRYRQLEAIGSIRIAYLFMDADLLPEVESALIEWFQPPLNEKGIGLAKRESESVGKSKPRELAEVLAISDVRSSLSKIRRQVQAGEVVPVEYYGSTVGYLVPLVIAKKLPLKTEREMNLTEFRSDTNSAWEAVDQGKLDCIWLTYHGDRRIAFVSALIYKPE